MLKRWTRQNKQCSIEGCIDSSHARSLCKKHYQRAKQDLSIPPPMTKICIDCEMEYPYASRSKRCKSCGAAKTKLKEIYWSRRGKKDKQERRKYDLKKYGITVEDYEELLKTQSGLCAICFCRQDARLHVDHDHQSGAIRGLLCNNCNFGLGLFRDSLPILKNAVSYLLTNDRFPKNYHNAVANNNYIRVQQYREKIKSANIN